jgi:head-tail adaptor
MRAGILNEVIVIRKPVIARDEFGAERVVYEDCGRVCAQVKYDSGNRITESHEVIMKPLEYGVKARVNKEATEAKVHIMANYMLKWFEMGTKPRFRSRKKLYMFQRIPSRAGIQREGNRRQYEAHTGRINKKGIWEPLKTPNGRLAGNRMRDLQTVNEF